MHILYYIILYYIIFYYIILYYILNYIYMHIVYYIYILTYQPGPTLVYISLTVSLQRSTICYLPICLSADEGDDWGWSEEMMIG